ncbi:septum formation family protein [Micromonospora endolithica]|uniref:Septum formation-related domain-containing protein n=1 Tax=Micromonospora endolithica TaxID=230091 RepID=A0A3A9YVU1_9ACTN|nr:septum formation family protein [Micromonospora endolithica]RKN40231.1 hypothetical protein D7223_26850 [Micromonospora endolithica]TWJ22540.1 putative regulator of septum formation [Micromonospora endolithica]
MRRWLIGVVLGAATALALGGCGDPPAGTDGDLTDDWTTIAAPAAFTPEAGTCHSQVQDVGYLSSYGPIGCDVPHRVETLHVGTLTGAAAQTDKPPAPGSAGTRTAYAACHREVNKALGADWRTGRVGVTVVYPSPAAWTGGSRWFRCDATEVRGVDDPSVVLRTGSLKGALTGAAPLRHGCYDPVMKGDAVTEMKAVACTSRHRAEFVGVWVAPDTSYAAFDRAEAKAHRACLSLVASYTKVPRSDVQFRIGSIYFQPYEQDWRNGDRGVQCFLWADDRTLTRSVKNAGTKALPRS